MCVAILNRQFPEVDCVRPADDRKWQARCKPASELYVKKSNVGRQ